MGPCIRWLHRKKFGARTGKLASEGFNKERPKVFKDLVVSLQYQDGKATEFYKGSKKFGGCYSKEGGYWDSTVEMFARAFDCYISDRLKEKGWKSGYLCGGANSLWRRESDGTITYQGFILIPFMLTGRRNKV